MINTQATISIVNQPLLISPLPVLAPVLDGIPKELASLDNWILWKKGADKTDGSGRWGKLPVNSRGYNIDAHDSCNHNTLAMAYSFYEAGFKKGLCHGVAFDLPNNSEPILNNASGIPLYLIGIDIDNCVNSNGVISEAVRSDIKPLGDVYIEVSPSGTGIRIFVLYPKPLKGGNKNSREMYSGGRFLTVTGLGMGSIKEVGVELEQLEDKWFKSRNIQAPQSIVKIDQATLNLVSNVFTPPNKVKDGEGRESTLLQYAASLRAKGSDQATIERILLAYNQQSIEPPLDDETVLDRARRYENAAIDAAIKTTKTEIELLNEDFFVAPYASTVAVFRKECDTYTPIRIEAFRLLFANKTVEMPSGNGTKQKPLADIWMQSPYRRQYAGVGLWPAISAPENYFNFWQGWPILPSKGNVQPALSHIENVICNGDKVLYKYLIGWLANTIQHPNEAGQVALVIMGGRGTGKTMFAEWIKAMFGRHAMSIANGNLLTGEFTGHLEKCVLLVAEEAFWAGDKKAENALKHLITGNTLSIHPKGYAPYDATNYLHVIMTSNEDWVVPAGVDERRFAVLNTSNDRKGDKAYFIELANWEKSGGISALLDYLLKYNLKGFDVRTPPDSEGLRTQKLMSMEPAARWIMTQLTDGSFCGGTWKSEVSAKDMVRDFCEDQRLNDYDRRRSETKLGMTLHKIFPTVNKARKCINGNREWFYQLPVTLVEARSNFEAYAGLCGHDWADDTD